MGPLHSSSIALGTGIHPGSRPWTSRKVRVPLNQLSRSMQFTHQRGVSVESVGFNYGAEKAPAVSEKVSVQPVQQVAEQPTKPSAAAPSKEAASKPKRRSGGRRRR